MKICQFWKNSTQMGKIKQLLLFVLFNHVSKTLFNLTLDAMQVLFICEFFKIDEN